MPSFSRRSPSRRPNRARAISACPFEGAPGPLNAITDVAGVEVGHKTLISGDSVRTGVTAVWPRGKQSSDPVFGGFFSQNGNGDMTGTHWLEESGFLDGPVLITNTHSVGVVRDAFLGWLVKNNRTPGTNTFDGGFYTYPIVAETYDGTLNDINGFHVKPADVEGRAGIGGAPARWRRATSAAAPAWSATALRAGSARRRETRGAGRVHGGRAGAVQLRQPAATAHRRAAGGRGADGESSARRSPMALSRRCRLDHHRGRDRRAAAAAPGAAAGAARDHGAGAHRVDFGQRVGRYLHRVLHRESRMPRRPQAPVNVSMLPNDSMNPVFEADVQATEEAIVNAMVGAETMSGAHGSKVMRCRTISLQDVLKKYNRLGSPAGR